MCLEEGKDIKGHINLGGVNIENIGLHHLRNKTTIIP